MKRSVTPSSLLNIDDYVTIGDDPTICVVTKNDDRETVFRRLSDLQHEDKIQKRKSRRIRHRENLPHYRKSQGLN